MNNLEEVKEEIRKEFQQVSKLMMEKLEKVLSSLVASETKVPKEKVWKPQQGKYYYSITGYGDVSPYIWEDNNDDNEHYELGNCFKTVDEAKATAEKIQIYTQLKRLAEEINEKPIDWTDKNQYKYFIYFLRTRNQIGQDATIDDELVGNIYSTNKNFSDIALERIGEENLLKLFEE